MKKRTPRLIGILLLLSAVTAGCGGGSGGGSTNVMVTHEHVFVLNSDAEAVVNQPSVGTFDEVDAGNTAPENFFSGPLTKMDGGGSMGLALAGNKTIYVANTLNSNLTVYSPDIKGNMAPTAIIAGASTGLMRPAGVAIDTNGTIFVADSGANAVLVFSAGSNGNVAPMATITGPATTLSAPTGIAVDQKGHLVVANTGADSVLTFASDASGNVAPTSSISGPTSLVAKPFGVAIDSSGRILITNDGSAAGQADAVLIFNVGDTGDVAPRANISGGNTMLDLPSGIGLDNQNQIVVANLGSNSIVVYPGTATGNQSPNEVIQGSGTRLSSPAGVAVATAAGPP
jgi:NHL repeat